MHTLPVRALAGGISRKWVIFDLYTHLGPANPSIIAAAKLYRQMKRPADRPLGPTRESRDFFTVSPPRRPEETPGE
jgi:hypothetical protein